MDRTRVTPHAVAPRCLISRSQWWRERQPVPGPGSPCSSLNITRAARTAFAIHQMLGSSRATLGTAHLTHTWEGRVAVAALLRPVSGLAS